MEIEWQAQDGELLAHTSRLRIGGKSAVTPHIAQVSTGPEVSGPQKAYTHVDKDLVGGSIPKNSLVIVGENIALPTMENLDKGSTVDALIERLNAKVIPDRINLTYPRIPGGFGNPLDKVKASAVVDAQLEVAASLIVPPLQGGLANLKQFNMVLERTLISMQTSQSRREVVGYFPDMEDLDLIPDMVQAYLKANVRFFAIDFASGNVPRSLVRSTVRSIRENLGIGLRAKERGETYYLHAFNVPTARKSNADIASLSDIITHPYGVDSTSGQMWGGGKLDKTKMRYYNTQDYGGYRPVALKSAGKPSCSCPVCSHHTFDEVYSGSDHQVYQKLRRHKLSAYSQECVTVASKIAMVDAAKGYKAYIVTKTSAKDDVEAVVSDVLEIRASLK